MEGIAALRESNAAAPPPPSPEITAAVVDTLVADVERSNRYFKKMADMSAGEAARVRAGLVEIFNDEVSASLRGWRALSGDLDAGIGNLDAMDEATAAVAQAARNAKAAGRKPIRVAIIGAGFSGLCAAIQLKQAGVEFEVFERSPRCGGVWW